MNPSLWGDAELGLVPRTIEFFPASQILAVKNGFQVQGSQFDVAERYLLSGWHLEPKGERVAAEPGLCPEDIWILRRLYLQRYAGTRSCRIVFNLGVRALPRRRVTQTPGGALPALIQNQLGLSQELQFELTAAEPSPQRGPGEVFASQDEHAILDLRLALGLPTKGRFAIEEQNPAPGDFL